MRSSVDKAITINIKIKQISSIALLDGKQSLLFLSLSV